MDITVLLTGNINSNKHLATTDVTCQVVSKMTCKRIFRTSWIFDTVFKS